MFDFQVKLDSSPLFRQITDPVAVLPDMGATCALHWTAQFQQSGRRNNKLIFMFKHAFTPFAEIISLKLLMRTIGNPPYSVM